MSGPLRPISAIRARAGTVERVSTAAAAVPRAPISDVVIDIGAAPSRANIVRDGREVPTPVVSPERSAALLENFIPVPRIEEPRAVRQSIAKGTLVSRGTAIDIEFLAPNRVTLGIFEGVHADLRARSVTDLTGLLGDPEVSAALAKPDESLTDADKQNLRVKLQGANIGVDDATPDRSLGAALVGLRTAQVFR